jgi:hypothetical protein
MPTHILPLVRLSGHCIPTSDTLCRLPYDL